MIDQEKNVDIDEADISKKDESNLNENDTSKNEADADITDSPNTVQIPHGTYSQIHPKHFAQIQAINATQPAFSTQQPGNLEEQQQHSNWAQK